MSVDLIEELQVVNYLQRDYLQRDYLQPDQD